MFWDSRIDSEFRKIWRFLDRFCCKVKSCLGISSQGNPDLVLNQQGNWVETQSYKVYTALLTQSGGDGGESYLYDGDSLIIGVTYEIFQNGDGFSDFTNVGAPNNDVGTTFVATGTTPNSWGNPDISTGTLKYNTGAPVATVLENTIGNIWFTYEQQGKYSINSNVLTPVNKTVFFIGPLNNQVDSGICVLDANSTDSKILFWTQLISGPYVDDLLFNTPIEIRVYN
jgi:hypothetical protein